MRANANNFRTSAPATVAYGGPFLLIAYLGIREGGFELPVYGEIGIAAWWAVLIFALSGRPRLHRPDPAGRGAILLLGLFAVWTAIALLFSDSAGRTAIELARVATYLGILGLVVALWTPESGRRILGGVAAAISLVAMIALLSRLHPSWFGPNELAETLPGIRSRLAYPIEYWNGLAGLVAIGLPLVLWAASTARTQLMRSLAAVVAPLLVLVIYLTLSRGGGLAALAGLALFVALYPVRTALLPSLLTTGLGSAVLIWTASRREALTAGLEDQLAADQGTELLVICLIVAIVIGLAHLGVSRLLRSAWIWFPRIDRGLAVKITAGVAVGVVIAGLATGAPGRIADGFDEFRQPADPGDTSSRLESASGNGRWQYWSAAFHAGEDQPLTGIGPGTFEFYWEREGTLPGYIVDAHSLYVEVFAELGVLGLLILGGFSVLVLVAAIRRALAALDAQRAMLAAAAGACLAFFFGAAIDWLWELPVIPIAFLLCAGVVLGEPAAGRQAVGRPSDQELYRLEARGGGSLRRSLLTGLAAVAGVIAIGGPLLSERALVDSQAAAAGDLPAALDAAERAQSWQPFAAEPRLQQALIVEQQGRYGLAAQKAREAIDREDVNWQSWFVLARSQVLGGNSEAGLRAYREARRLNPDSNVLELPQTDTGTAAP